MTTQRLRPPLAVSRPPGRAARQNPGTTLAGLLALLVVAAISATGLASAAAPSPPPARSAYAGDWTLYVKPTTVGQGECGVRPDEVGVEVAWRVAINATGRITVASESGKGMVDHGQVSASGSVALRDIRHSDSTRRCAPMGASGACSSTQLCDGTAGRRSTTAAWRLERVVSTPAPAPVWATATAITTPRASLAAAVVAGKLYTFGGNPGTGATGISEMYDPATQTWSSLPNMPTPRGFSSANAPVVGGIIYLVGDNGPGHCTNVVEAFDPATDTWSTKASMPTPRCSLSVATVGGIIYAIGGGTGNGPSPTYSAVEAYDPVTDSWASKASMPTPRQSFGLVAAGGKLYAVGGVYTAAPLTTLEVYDPATDSWSSRAAMPTGRSSLGFAQVGSHLYAVAGLTATGTTAVVEAYDLASDAWAANVPLPAPRTHTTASNIDGILYVAGGVRDDGSTPSEVYTLALA